MTNAGYVVLSVALVAGAWTWQSDEFQRSVRPRAYWSDQAEQARDDIRTARWILREVDDDKLELEGEPEELRELLDEEAVIAAEKKAWEAELADAEHRLEMARDELSRL